MYSRSISLVVVVVFLIAAACNEIETGDTLKAEDIAYIRSLGLLDKDERIHKFYSGAPNKIAGNYFADRRMTS